MSAGRPDLAQVIGRGARHALRHAAKRVELAAAELHVGQPLQRPPARAQAVVAPQGLIQKDFPYQWTLAAPGRRGIWNKAMRIVEGSECKTLADRRLACPPGRQAPTQLLHSIPWQKLQTLCSHLRIGDRLDELGDAKVCGSNVSKRMHGKKDGASQDLQRAHLAHAGRAPALRSFEH